jgi:hypothetical protein
MNSEQRGLALMNHRLNRRAGYTGVVQALLHPG